MDHKDTHDAGVSSNNLTIVNTTVPKFPSAPCPDCTKRTLFPLSSVAEESTNNGVA